MGILDPRNLFPRKFVRGRSAKILSLENTFPNQENWATFPDQEFGSHSKPGTFPDQEFGSPSQTRKIEPHSQTKNLGHLPKPGKLSHIPRPRIWVTFPNQENRDTFPDQKFGSHSQTRATFSDQGHLPIALLFSRSTPWAFPSSSKRK